jgi:hypothetical protein
MPPKDRQALDSIIAARLGRTPNHLTAKHFFGHNHTLNVPLQFRHLPYESSNSCNNRAEKRGHAELSLNKPASDLWQH